MPGAKKRTERRRWERLPLAIPLFVRGVDPRGKEFLEFATALNVSAGGALLAVKRYLPRSSRVSLEIPSAPLPRKLLPRHFVRTLRARVVRVAPPADLVHFSGLQFQRPLV